MNSLQRKSLRCVLFTVFPKSIPFHHFFVKAKKAEWEHHFNGGWVWGFEFIELSSFFEKLTSFACIKKTAKTTKHSTPDFVGFLWSLSHHRQTVRAFRFGFCEPTSQKPTKSELRPTPIPLGKAESPQRSQNRLRG